MKSIPTLLDILDVKGCIITIDAIGCQHNIAKNILDQEADYYLAVKNNNPKLYEELEKYFSNTQGSLMGNIKQTS